MIHRPLALAGVLAASAFPALAQDDGNATPPRALVTVIGEGSAQAAPDLAVTSLTVLRTAEEADAALSAANEAADAVGAAMRELGIEGRDLQTGRFQITPQYRYENREDGTSLPPEIVGYEVRNSLTVRVRDLARLGELLDRAVELGVNQGGDISFQIEDSAALEDEARAEAVERARASAETLARAAGRELGDVVSITDEAAMVEPPAPIAMESRMMSAAPASVPIEVGENIVTARVRVSFELTEGNMAD